MSNSKQLDLEPMNIIVCVKQVPDAAEVKFDTQRRVLIREGIKNVLNPFDRRAIAEAARIKANNGGSVTAMTMGPPQAKESLLECFVVGADKAVHLMDGAFAGADTLATARALAMAINREPFDLIICGKHSIDAETGQVGPEIAELLGIPHVTGVTSLSFDSRPGYLTAERETDEGIESIECKLPALITAAERLVRPVKIKEGDIDSVRENKIEVITASELSPDNSIFGAAGSPTWVSEIISLQKSRQVEMIDGGIEQMVETLLDRLTERGVFSRDKVPQGDNTSAVYPVVESKEGRDVWAIAELTGSELRAISYELLGKGKELARRLGGKVVGVLVGENIAHHAQTLAAYGADAVYLIQGEPLALFNPLHYAAAIAQAIEELRPHIVLIPSTANGRDYAPRVAARLGLGLTADCVDLDLNDKNDLVQFKPAFGGQIVAPIFSRTWPQMATVRPGVLAKLDPDMSLSPTIRNLEISINEDDRYRVLAFTEEARKASAELDDAEVVVCVGMGIGGEENLPVVKELARTLGGAIGATRRVVDRGWLPRQQQIGITGRAVAPRLYVGVGVRGVFNHTIGIQRADCIVAINNDPQADIFQTSDYGLAADYAEIVPVLTAAVARRKAQLADA